MKKLSSLYSIRFLIALSVISFVLIQSCSKTNTESVSSSDNLSRFEKISTLAKNYILNPTKQGAFEINPELNSQEILTKTTPHEKEIINEIVTYSNFALLNEDASSEFNTLLGKIQTSQIVNKESLLSTLYLAKGTINGLKEKKSQNTMQLVALPVNLGCCYTSALYYFNYMINSSECHNCYEEALNASIEYMEWCYEGEMGCFDL